jgi:hypothetical protein
MIGKKIPTKASGVSRAPWEERNGDAASVRSEKVLGLQWVQFPPGNWVAPAGSYRSGGGGNETVGAFETDVSLWRCSEPTGRNASER